MTQIRDLLKFIEEIAPPALQEEWDNSGLQVGSTNGRPQRVLLALSPSLSVINEGVEMKAQLLITHHPLIFKPLKSIDASTSEGKAIELALKHQLSIYSCHTNLDKARRGTSRILAERLGVGEIKPLLPEGELLKLAVFVPREHTQKVLNALAEAGAGHIGNYSHCSFRVAGTGTFLPLGGASPFIGRQGRLEEVQEDRLEMIFPAHLRSRVIENIMESHPYEEVAYDLYPLASGDPSTGLGGVGRLKEPLSAEAFTEQVKNALNGSGIRISGDRSKTIQRVACVGGSGGKYLPFALKAGADAYVTGDAGYHDGLEAEENGLLLIDAGHFATEWPVMEELQRVLSDQFPDVEFLLSEKDREPFDLK